MQLPEILLADNPLLKTKSSPVSLMEIKQGKINHLLDTMLAVMKLKNGAGLAAPQIGILKRVIVYGVNNNPRYPDVEKIPETILINPEIEWASEETSEYLEGCLSLPNIRGMVKRPVEIKILALDRDGKKIRKIIKGFEARIIQHEIDHLNGILFTSRLNSSSL